VVLLWGKPRNEAKFFAISFITGGIHSFPFLVGPGISLSDANIKPDFTEIEDPD